MAFGSRKKKEKVNWKNHDTPLVTDQTEEDIEEWHKDIGISRERRFIHRRIVSGVFPGAFVHGEGTEEEEKKYTDRSYTIDEFDGFVQFEGKSAGRFVYFSSNKAADEDSRSKGDHFLAALVNFNEAKPKNGKAKLLIYCHGYNQSIRQSLYVAKAMNIIDDSFEYLLLEYPGYVAAPGEVSFPAIDLMVSSAISYAQTDLGYSPENIVLMGFSAGCGVAISGAITERLGGVILFSPTSCFPDLAKYYHGTIQSYFYIFMRKRVFGVKTLPYNNVARIHTVQNKVLIIADKEDNYIPYALSEKLYKAALKADTDVAFVTTHISDHSARLALAQVSVQEAIKSFTS